MIHNLLSVVFSLLPAKYQPARRTIRAMITGFQRLALFTIGGILFGVSPATFVFLTPSFRGLASKVTDESLKARLG